MKQKKQRRSLKFPILTAVTAAAVAALMWHRCVPPKTETIQKPMPKICVAPPEKGDNKCEVSKGEADPLSPTFDPKSCGYCGDEIRQIKAENGSGIILDLDTLQYVQEVTERPSETPENCPVDFHCGNMRVDFRGVFAAVVEFTEEKGEERTKKYKYGTVLKTETCNPKQDNYCKSDCRLLKPVANGKEEEEEEVEEVEPVAPKSYGTFTCPSQVGVDSRESISTNSASARAVIRRAIGAVRENAPKIRETMNAEPSDKVHAILSLLISPNGAVSLRHISASCQGEDCEKALDLKGIVSLSFDGMLVSAPGTECYWTLHVRVP